MFGRGPVVSPPSDGEGLRDIQHSMRMVLDTRFHIWFIVTLYYKMRQILLENATTILLENATEVYYKMRQTFYYKMRQLLQTATVHGFIHQHNSMQLRIVATTAFLGLKSHTWKSKRSWWSFFQNVEVAPFLEIQDVPTFYKSLRKAKVLNNSSNQFVYHFYPQSILIFEECLQKWWNANLI